MKKTAKFKELSEAWRSLLPGDKVTTEDLANLVTDESDPLFMQVKRAATIVLPTKVSKGEAKKLPISGIPGARFIYQKLSKVTPPVSVTFDEISATGIGESIIELINNLTSRIKELNSELKQLTEEHCRLRKDYTRLQERNLELQQNKPKSINLHEVQGMLYAKTNGGGR